MKTKSCGFAALLFSAFQLFSFSVFGGVSVTSGSGQIDSGGTYAGIAISNGTFSGTSTFTGPVIIYAFLPSNTSAPVLSSTNAGVGIPLTCTSGTWTNSPASYSYQWQSSATGTSGWADISGATSGSYTPVSADVGNHLRCGLQAANLFGAGTFACSAATGAVANINLLSGLLAYWKLDDTSWADSSGNGYSLTDNNITSCLTGLIGNCASFDGSSTWLTASTLPALAPGDFTIAFWLKWTGGSGQGMCDWNDGINLGNYGGTLGLYLSYTGGGLIFPNSTFNATDGNWHFICIVNDSADSQVNLYVDNALVDTLSYSGHALAPGYSPEALTFGGQADGTNLCQEMIDEAGVWTRQLSPAEMTTLYNSGAGHTDPF